MKKVIVIGSGFAGLSAAACLAQKGFDVTVLEKNDSLGGRARQWITEGFVFDMGPSWYWMPDVFEDYFALFGKKVSDYYELHRLDPAYKVCFGSNDFVDIPANMEELENLFESYEEGSSSKLREFLAQAKYKYEVGMGEYVFRASHSITEFIDYRLMKESLRIQMLTSMSKHVRTFFKNEKLIKLLEFPVLFLGATPQNTPAMYSMMNYADLSLGTWYPMGGMHKIIEAMVKVAEEQGVKFETETEVQKIVTKNGKAKSVLTSKGEFQADWVVAGNDYHNADQKLLDKTDRNYTEKYWDDRTMSPSSLLFYLGIDKRLDNLEHHNLFFDEDFNQHAEEIYTNPQWPSKPLFYACCPSQTDDTVAPEGKENLFLLIPIAPGLPDGETIREKYYNLIMDRLEKLTGQKIREHVILKRNYALDDFKFDYNSFKGNAYGLANTLSQTAFFKPKMKSKKISNLFFTGQLTVPGPGVPPSIISGRVVADEVAKEAKKIFQ
ncbi:phytoene desaturase [Bernardetia litoralis DSM 6794]|uniref:Phytoene desaturase n=1 Tax=Bernardetia litoralis (strain ATCC 23117 / DSM 6794 / NBRC 15988 / NCIMB 1366 / Fx l1 / Sio-4) TaxID=880071 RepID=I4AGY7_BERLS|nr:phytoene desaturase family protein [Bernardetia litoralis]AFM03222.1 phytoene desaturase [Bernardetia litoralis DSM 6794]